MKVYIVGPVGSGKTTLAHRVSLKVQIPCTELDRFVHVPDDKAESGNARRPEQERDDLFNAILKQSSWLMEDIGRECFEEGLRQADMILWVDPPRIVREYRLLVRYCKQRFGIENCLYRPSLGMLKNMFCWSNAYETGVDGCRLRYQKYADKLVKVRTERQLKRLLDSFGN